MFTGLIEAIGTVRLVDATAAGVRMRVETALALALGDSVAVNGVCLTVVDSTAEDFAADISPETLRVTTLDRVRAGTTVNLERPLRADSRLGGHFVQGHVDGTGLLRGVVEEGESYRLTFQFPAGLARYMIRKGSIAIDGISLTIADLGTERFEVQIIPYTWSHTNLRDLRLDDPVNLECDLLGKYVVRLIELGFQAGAAGTAAEGARPGEAP